jgi:hypothetical protein
MELVAQIVVPILLVTTIAGFLVKRGGALVLVLPVVIAAFGAMWIYGALEHYQRATGRELTGLIGYHYSMPEWGFEYAPNGRRIEGWSFTVPAYTTLVLLLASAAVASVRKWHELRGWEIVGLWIYHFGCAAAFMVVYALLWIHAASVFI